jgi:hypothetical protein
MIIDTTSTKFFKVQTYPSPRQSASQQTSPSPSTKKYKSSK